MGELARHVAPVARAPEVAGLVVFDHGGITGHLDHQRATDADLAAARILGVPVVA